MQKMMSVLVAMMFLLVASPFVSVAAYSAPNVSSHGQDSAGVLNLAVGSSVQPGIILYAGGQSWSQSGGKVVGAYFNGVPIGHPHSDVSYNLESQVTGLSAAGSFSVKFSNSQEGQTISLNAEGFVIGYTPSVCFPSYSPGTCSSGDTSAIPAFFEALVSGTLDSNGAITPITSELFLIETSIMNPFGGPIVISSADKSIVIVATYQQSNVQWEGVQLTGAVSGTYNGGAASGAFFQTVNANENLVSGTESETGTIAFINMSPSSLNAGGTFSGTSTTPRTGGVDCSGALGLPAGTCTETALSSHGIFHMTSQDDSTITGVYKIFWPAPSVVFGGSITAAVHQDS